MCVVIASHHKFKPEIPVAQIEPGWEPKSGREKNNVCRNGVSRVNFSKYTQNRPSILASASLVSMQRQTEMEDESDSCELLRVL